MYPEITLAQVPFANNSQIKEEKNAERLRIEKNDAEIIREWELTRRGLMLGYSNSLLRIEDSFLLERNILETIVSGPYLSSSDRLTNPQLASENPSFLYRASKFLSENQISSILSVTCLTVLPSAVACVSSVTEDLAKYREDLCYSYFIPSIGVASIFTAITFAAPSIQRYLNNGDQFLLLLRQYRDNLDSNANEINAPNNGVQAPVPASASAREQVQAQDPALRVEAQNQATGDSIVSGQLVFFHNQTPAPAPAQAPVPVPAQAPAPASSFGDDAQDDGRVADSGNDLIQFLLEIGQQGVQGSAQLLRSMQNTSAEARLVFFSQFQTMNQTSEGPSNEISSIGAQSFQGSPQGLGPDRV